MKEEVIAVSKNEAVDYLAYMTLQSSFVQTHGLLSGFMLTIIVLLLTMLPDPTQILSQITLFVLALLFMKYGLDVRSELYVLIRCVKVAPSIAPATMRYFRLTSNFTNYGMLIVIPLIFLLWNLIYLALATAITTIVLYVIDSLMCRPLSEYASKAWIRK